MVNQGKSDVKPSVIWKAENSRWFKGVKKIELPVEYYSQPKVWMMGDILQRVLSKLNCQLRQDGRSVILLLDNDGCPSPDMNFSNIKTGFFACKHNISASTT